MDLSLKTYKIQYQPAAEKDLNNVLEYFSEILDETAYANRICNFIRMQILTLKKMPARFAIIDIEPYKHLEIRLMTVRNYNVFYTIHEDSEVHIVRIFHEKRDWMKLL